MKTALFGFSFDDGRIDQFTTAYPILKKYGLPATFNITTSYIEQRPTEYPFTEVPPMTIDMLRQLHADPQMEIASHGYWHHNAPDNLLHGVQTLCELLQTDYLYKNSNGIALTGNTVYTMDEEILLAKAKDLKIPIQYIRHSIRRPSFPWLKILARKINRVVPSPVLFRFAMSDSLMLSAESHPDTHPHPDTHSDDNPHLVAHPIRPHSAPFSPIHTPHSDDNPHLVVHSHPLPSTPITPIPSPHILYSIPIVGNKHLSDMQAIIEKTIYDRAACIFMMHSIVPDGQCHNPYEMERSHFEALCTYLSQCQKDSRLQVATSLDICQALSD